MAASSTPRSLQGNDSHGISMHVRSFSSDAKEEVDDASTSRIWLIGMSVLWLFTVGVAVGRSRSAERQDADKNSQDPVQNAVAKVERGQHTFRFDTFSDQAFLV